MKKRVLIYSVSAGSGHNIIANKIKAMYEAKNYDVTVLDFFKDNSKKFRAYIVDKGYQFIIKNVLPIYNCIYKKMKTKKNNCDKCINGKSDKNMQKTLNNCFNDADIPIYLKTLLVNMHKEMIKNICEIQPDFIICTHVFPTLSLCRLKEHFQLHTPLYAYITDLSPHPFWSLTVNNVDLFFALSHTKEIELLQCGIEKHKIRRYQIYQNRLNKSDFYLLNNSLVLKVLVITKNVKHKEIRQNLMSFQFCNRPVNVHVLCSGNLHTLQLVKNIVMQIRNPNVIFTTQLYATNNEMNILLNIADVVLSKGGINAIYQILSNACVFIPFNDIPHQEKENVQALSFDNLFPLLDKYTLIADYINNEKFSPSNLSAYKQNIYNFLCYGM